MVLPAGTGGVPTAMLPGLTPYLSWGCNTHTTEYARYPCKHHGYYVHFRIKGILPPSQVAQRSIGRCRRPEVKQASESKRHEPAGALLWSFFIAPNIAGIRQIQSDMKFSLYRCRPVNMHTRQKAPINYLPSRCGGISQLRARNVG